VNDNDDDLELAALQRQLDDAFETTRPRPGFDDELWLRVQSSRPVANRLRDALSGLIGGVRAVPTVPLAAAAAFLVIALLIGLVARFGAGGGNTATSSFGGAAPAPGQFYAGSFGKLPTPVFSGQKSTTPTADNGQQPAVPAYFGPVQFTWTGKLTLNITTASVYRYREPSPDLADQFATGHGAVLRDRPSGFLGMYTAADYTLKVRGTLASPPSSPAYFIFASLTMPPTEAAGAGPADQANIFLAQHSLVPQWSNTVEVDSSGDPIKVRYDRQFDVAGYGPAYLVDVNGRREGLEVDLSANRPVLATGLLPMSLDSADYKIISADDAVRSAVGTSSSGAAAGATPVPTVQLTQAELVYVLVPAGDHSFYEPAFLFSGTLKLKDQTLTERVLVPAVDPSQRNP
jgi:hypothetical protein